jgi:hypothetical protein
MAQAPNYEVENGAGAAVRGDLNTILAALLTFSAGAAEPATPTAFMPWADTLNNRLKIRNAANTAWLILPLSITAGAEFPDQVTALNNIIGRAQLILGASGAEWQVDPDEGASGATLTLGPRVGSVLDPTKGITIDRATGQVEVGDGATAGAADHLAVNGGVEARDHGFTFPDGTLAPTAGIISVHTAIVNSYASFFNTSSFASHTGFNLAITPQSAASSFIILATLCAASSGPGFWRVSRDGAGVALNAGPGNRTPAHGDTKAPAPAVPMIQTVVLKDNPATAAQITYGIQFQATSGSSIHLNQGYSVVNVASELAGVCTLTVLEIGG